jgi:polysaccharide biosynthesis/export protein
MKLQTSVYLLFLIIISTLASASSEPDVYLLGVNDVMQLNVLQNPDMDRQLTIRQDGTVVLPPVGIIQVSGFSIKEAEQRLKAKLELFDRDIQEVTLTVIEFNSLQIYILGAVNNSGMYTFSDRPSLWDLIKESGGVTSDALLSEVKVISKKGATTQTRSLDITNLISGDYSSSPVFLQSGDTVVIPSSEQLMLTSSSNGVQVFGGIASPGTYRLKEPMRIVDVLMLAGAPTDGANLKKVIWVHKVENSIYSSSIVNCQLFLQDGSLLGNPLVYSGDVIHVTIDGGGFWRTVYPLLLGTLTTAATVAFALHRIGT